MADPPAESPSTRYISHSEGSFIEQSASFPGRELLSRMLCLRTNSRAFLAALLALLAASAFPTMFFASPGFSSRNSESPEFSVDSTKPFISGFPSFVLVWPSNCGSSIFTLTTAVRPSLTSSPLRLPSFSLIMLCDLEYSLTVLVSAALNPTR